MPEEPQGCEGSKGSNPERVRGTAPIVGMRFCSRCLAWKEETEFARNRVKASGRSSWCKECAKLHERNRREGTKGRTPLHFSKSSQPTGAAKRSPFFQITDEAIDGILREFAQCQTTEERAEVVRAWSAKLGVSTAYIFKIATGNW